MSRSAFLDAAPVELHAFLERLAIQDRKAQGHTAQILSMLANCHGNREANNKPDGWSPKDFMPDAEHEEREPSQLSMKEWVLALEAGKLSEPITESEKQKIRNLNQRMTTTYTGTKTGVVIQVPR